MTPAPSLTAHCRPDGALCTVTWYDVLTPRGTGKRNPVAIAGTASSTAPLASTRPDAAPRPLTVPPSAKDCAVQSMRTLATLAAGMVPLPPCTVQVAPWGWSCTTTA